MFHYLFNIYVMQVQITIIRYENIWIYNVKSVIMYYAQQSTPV